MLQKVVFYSWQSDSDDSLNRFFIADCLKRAIRKLGREDLPNLVIDRDTKNVPGMPDIGQTILEKIARAAVVVADLTLINPTAVRREGERPVSNPNVLFELGYGFGKLGPKAMIGVFNSASGAIGDLPFDIRPKRLMTYDLNARGDRVEVRQSLVDDLASAIRQSIGDTEEDQIQRESEIHSRLFDIWTFGTEIGDWFGIERLPAVIDNMLCAARELLEPMNGNAYPKPAMIMASKIIEAMEQADTITLNQENWPRISELITSAAQDVGLIDYIRRFNPDPDYHDKLVRQVMSIPANLDGLAQNIKDGKFSVTDLDNLSKRLRKAAFVKLIPQHPKFDAGLKGVSLDLRRHLLRWVKATPPPDEAVEILRAVGGRVTQLLVSYAPVGDSNR